jgi:hypothetical protein
MPTASDNWCKKYNIIPNNSVLLQTVISPSDKYVSIPTTLVEKIYDIFTKNEIKFKEILNEQDLKYIQDSTEAEGDTDGNFLPEIILQTTDANATARTLWLALSQRDKMTIH